MDKREHPRMVMKGMAADISDGKGFFSGMVHDISRFGLSLYDVPRKIDAQSGKNLATFLRSILWAKL
jgi:hypothetical protein